MSSTPGSKQRHVDYRIGGLFPRRNDGSPNVILSSDLKLETNNGFTRIVSRSLLEDDIQDLLEEENSTSQSQAELTTNLRISSDPVSIPGIDRFINDWLRPQITSKSNPDSLFTSYLNAVVRRYTSNARNRTIKNLLSIGYIGPGSDESATNDAYWNQKGESSDELNDAIQDLDNYDPEKLWENYKNTTEVRSDFQTNAILENLHTIHSGSDGQSKPDLWYPSLIYTYGTEEDGTSYPAPLLMAEPGDRVSIEFHNDIRIAGLSTEQNLQAAFIENSSYGNSAAGGLGGTTSTNIHYHGFHVNSSGFGDNVVSRYSTGQRWTSKLNIPKDHGIGFNWYHPHYHPSVNQMVYGGLSGPFQVGDPLSKVPRFSSAPRNMAVLKTMEVGIDQASGALELDNYDGLGSVVNRMAMVTVNGEYQPTANAGQGGWQSLSLSNQANVGFYGIALEHTDSNGNTRNLPLYIYGEDGHQSPQIRAVSHGMMGQSGERNTPSGYTQAENIVSLQPGKRIDLMVYLPQGESQLTAQYSFEKGGESYSFATAGGYPNLTDSNTGFGSRTGSGPLARFNVTNGTAIPTDEQLAAEIEQANKEIAVQNILPTTESQDYDNYQVPSINLYQEDDDGNELWKPIKNRQFNWTKETLVGPAEEYDAETKHLLDIYSAMNDGATYEPYTKLPIGDPGVSSWHGYEKPFLINDHVFPYAPLVISQLGTIEEWTNRNWSIGRAGKYIAHPYHIHINDYQVKDSDSELPDKRNLEDVTGINSSGYDFYDTETGQIQTQQPLRGEFHSIDEARDPSKVKSLTTFGANDQTLRMLFQDYLGTYVFHCHILPHEDQGMMSVVTVVENTDSSWLIPAEGFKQSDGAVEVHNAQTFSPAYIHSKAPDGQSWIRAQSGDLSHDFVQDIVLMSGGGSSAGAIQIVDGAALQQGETELGARLTPYDSTLAPWAFIEDFSGDGRRDLVTAGFDQKQNKEVNLKDLEIKAFLRGDEPGQWIEQFHFDPFDDVSLTTPAGAEPRHQLTADQVSVTMVDMNLDNFQDVAMAYAVEGGLRLLVLDGAALSLAYQTGQMEGGYFADSNVLTDALFLDSDLNGLSELVLAGGFSSYEQSPIENLIVTTNSSAGRQQFTMQLQAGHFIATQLPKPDSGESSMEGHGGHGGHGAGGMTADERIIQNRDGLLPLHVVDELLLPSSAEAVTPIINGGPGTPGSLVAGYAVIAQGDGNNGNPSNSDVLINSTQQLVIPLTGLDQVDIDDLTGITDSRISDRFDDDSVNARNQLTAATYFAYTGRILDPGALAMQSAGILGTGEKASELVNHLVSMPTSREDIQRLYGNELSDMSISDIVETAYQTLYGRGASSNEKKRWKQEVKKGLDQTFLPQAILMNTDGNDTYRVAAISAGLQWTPLQWGTSAAIDGSFSQGLVEESAREAQIIEKLNCLGTFKSWDEANEGFDQFQDHALSILIGTPVAKSGIF